MFRDEGLNAIRQEARAFEEALPLPKRKRLGQYFTGLPLGRLLAHLALDENTRTVLDPMAGHGDLLDAAWDAAQVRGIELQCLDGVELDEETATWCRRRLGNMEGRQARPAREILSGTAFAEDTILRLPTQCYDLVITNPPYVRYQSQDGSDQVRNALTRVIAKTIPASERGLWTELAEGYSGLADISVPAWLLSALLVRPGGRLALVVPATWRSRGYADVIRYLMLRCFSLDCVVEDRQPGWFSDALVRTHLIIARRVSDATPLNDRQSYGQTLWIQVDPSAADDRSLVGHAFKGGEAAFAAWARHGCSGDIKGVTARYYDLEHEWHEVRKLAARKRWYRALENHSPDLPLFSRQGSQPVASVPASLRDILPCDTTTPQLITLADADIEVGQGLRTGCNGFFYVDVTGPIRKGFVPVRASPLLGTNEFSLPEAALLPVLRKQSELTTLRGEGHLNGRVLDLRQWALPEDMEAVREALPDYAACGKEPPAQMPDELATYVRLATMTTAGKDGRLVPDLSAVSTNVRAGRAGRQPPRFWYMLPDFASRHMPVAFTARINHGLPWVECNSEPPLIVDANFSTFWSPGASWTRFAIKALLNSIWCRVAMEALGTPLGGGALKLEASHLRRLAVPDLSNEARTQLDEIGRSLTRGNEGALSSIDEIVIKAALPQINSDAERSGLVRKMVQRAGELSSGRRRAA